MVNHFFRILSLLIFIFCCLISNSNNSAIQAQPKTAAKSKSKTAKKPSKADKLFASARDYLVIQNNPTEAEKIFKKIIKKYPNYLQAYNELADLYTAQKKYADMRKIYTTMLERGKTPKNQFMVHLKWGEIEKNWATTIPQPYTSKKV
ncbi:MAG: tetratricopeptide repeat protein [Sphingobacteriales bacterium]|nr:tetratricopeptide repeat protein [Sphingobacteriales bacterium]